MPRRFIAAKLVRSTMEKSWSGQEMPICHAVSKSAKPTGSIVATPLLRPCQNRSAAFGCSLWWINVHVSTKT